MTEHWAIFVVEYANNHEPWVGLVSGMQDEGMVDLPFSFVVATNGQRKLLIDTGFMKSGSEEEFPLKFSISRWTSPLTMLAALNIAATDITDIVLTHAHFDHMGCIGEYPNAQIHIQKSELLSWYEAIALPKRYAHLTTIIDPQNLREALEASIERRVALIDGDKNNVLPGIHVRLGSGHTLGHQFVIIEAAAGRYVVSGDCAYTTRQFAGHHHDEVYVPLNNATGSVWEQLKTLDRVDQEIEGDFSKLIILHDVNRWHGFPVVAEVDGFSITQIA